MQTAIKLVYESTSSFENDLIDSESGLIGEVNIDSIGGLEQGSRDFLIHQQNGPIAVVLGRAFTYLSNVCRAPVLWAFTRIL